MRSVRRRASRASTCHWAVSAAQAAPRPTSWATGSRPARRARSWSPPTRSGGRRRPRRTSRAPVPAGPPSLWPLSDNRSAPSSVKAMASRPAAWAASTWTSTPRSRQAATTSATGWVVPTSWLPHCTCTTAVSARIASSTACGSARPVPSTGTTVTGPDRSAAWRTAECSTAVTTWWTGAPAGPTVWPAVRLAARAAPPHTAAAIASVAPLVNTTSRLRAPSRVATCSRAVSRATRAVRPSSWMRPGSPTSVSRASTIAARASGRSGEVEAWSR